MIAAWVALPLALRLGLLAVIGLLAGGLANHVIYTWCWFPRPISPWVRGPEGTPARTASDRIPLVGWISRRGESDCFGRGFWIRPLLVELLLAIVLPWLYWYECHAGGLLPPATRAPALIDAAAAWLHYLYVSHLCLFVLMTAATFIDFDEQTIPDVITVPGTLLALISGAISIDAFLPAESGGRLIPVTYNVPGGVDPGWFSGTGLLTALAIWTGWCFALADRRVILRRGWAKAVQYFLAGLIRHPTWKVLAGMWLVGLVAIAAVWKAAGPGINAHWLGLFSALVGLAVGGGLVWAVRLVASAAMGVEAMGFGDVTLMAMIGAFLGWQASLSTFFLAPIAAIVIVLIQFVITRQPRVPFGPYLCAGAVLTIIFWDRLFNGWLEPNLAMGPILLWLAAVMFVLMGVFLFVWRQLKRALFRPAADDR